MTSVSGLLLQVLVRELPHMGIPQDLKFKILSTNFYPSFLDTLAGGRLFV